MDIQNSPRTARRSAGTAIAVAFALATFASLGLLRQPWAGLTGDESTFVAMTESVAMDRDLTFDERDAGRIRDAAPHIRPGAVILQRVEDRLSYSKPVVYPLLAAPFFALFGPPGMVLTNLLLLLFGIVIADRRLQADWGRGRGWDAERAAARATLAAFLCCSVVLPYTAWRMSEAAQVGLALAGLGFALDGVRGRAWRSETVTGLLGGVLLALVAMMRFPNAVLLAAPVGITLWRGRPQRAVALLLGAGLTLAVVGGWAWLGSGTVNPYKAARASFTAETGFPTTPDRFDERFVDKPATQSIRWDPATDPTRSLYSTVYFFIGRHTGLLLYFPLALVLLAGALRRRDATAMGLVAAFSTLVAFYLIWKPSNFFGGATFLGNRYVLAAYPALLLAPPRPPRRAWVNAVWAFSFALGLSAVASVGAARSLDTSSQNHVHAGVFRLFPHESTARGIDGERTRYWADDFVRFTDPWADVGTTSFTLIPGRPPTEVAVATADDEPPLEFLVEGRPRGHLTVDTGWSEHEIDVGRRTFEVPLGRTWRRHRFWWRSDALYAVHAPRFRWRSAHGDRLELRYAGDGSLLRRKLAWKLHELEVPTEARTGTVVRLPVRVQNRGPAAWAETGVAPVALGYRLWKDGLGDPIEGRRTHLPRRVESGGLLETEMVVQWPDEPGEYLLAIDLVQEGVTWFSERVGSPLAEKTVNVAPAS